MATNKLEKAPNGSVPAPAGKKDAPASTRRAKTPTVLQMEAAECGAAALGIILGYYKRFVPLEELRVECGVSRDGSIAANIIKAARKYGLTAKGFRKEPSSLRKSAMPVIAHWNFNHFLVVEGFSKNKVYLNDPANGPTVVTYEEFDDQFTGVILTFEPGPDFVKGGKKYDAIAALRKRLGNSGKALTYVIMAGIALVIPGLLVPVFSQVFVDYYLVRQLKSWLFPLIIGMLLTALMRAGLTWLREFYLLKLETKLAATMSSKFFWHVLRLPLGYFYQRFAGDIGGRVAINDQVAALISGRLASTALDILTIVFYAILMFIYDPVLTGAVILIAALNLVALRYVARKRVDINQHFLQESGKLLGVSMSGLHIIETLKAIGRESDFFARWAGYHVKVNRANQRAGIYSQFLEAVPPLLASINVAVILTLGGLRIIQGDLTIGMLVAFQSLALSFITPINQLVELGSTLQDTEGGLKRLDDVLANPLDPVAARNEDATEISRHSPKLTGYLELRNIKFGYSRLAPPLIENFNLSLRPGSRVALVGGSGSGKSTIAKLVSGLFDPWEGEVLFDGKARQDWSRAVVNNSLAVVDQEIFLFEGSIRENLTLWDSTISEIQYVRAAKDAHIHDEISARPEGYNSRVAEEGVNFSGGQRQRLEIARALTADPAVLILDEATSALDPVTEKLIDENLRRRGCTCLIIAHRLSTIRDCDEIIVMEKGKIVQRGTHLEMKDEPDSPYAKLIAS